MSSRLDRIDDRLSQKVFDVSTAVGDLRSDASRQGAKLDQIDDRVKTLEARFNAKFGADDAGIDAGTHPWSPEHIAQREKHCRKRCADNAACFSDCAAAFNACGIAHPADITSPSFRSCIEQIR